MAASLDFFVSHTQADLAWAAWIAWTLEEADYQVLVQAWDSPPGSNWVAAMNDGVARARRMIVVLSAAYSHSAHGAEWLYAWKTDPDGQQRRLLPVRVEDCERPGLLDTVTGVDLFALDEPAAQTVLLKAAQHAVCGGRAKPEDKPIFPPNGRALRQPVSFPGEKTDEEQPPKPPEPTPPPDRGIQKYSTNNTNSTITKSPARIQGSAINGFLEAREGRFFHLFNRDIDQLDFFDGYTVEVFSREGCRPPDASSHASTCSYTNTDPLATIHPHVNTAFSTHDRNRETGTKEHRSRCRRNHQRPNTHRCSSARDLQHATVANNRDQQGLGHQQFKM
ncbi:MULTISPECIES: toll/interleukin-1 receptor domain-containing protein [Protofrankia]|uniref:toll/interleukin-1 receptor domain-containing protein n=1 Tax=Protofrankia TaxID=2994361 RepID=UPI000976A75C|nr:MULTISPECIES: toll/interleukin-1 receptor domain-containing protein [Protofrankia]